MPVVSLENKNTHSQTSFNKKRRYCDRSLALDNTVGTVTLRKTSGLSGINK